MKVPLVASICAIALASLPARAAFPLEEMNAHRLGLQYGLAFRGQDITSADVPSYETIHSLGLAYSPVPYFSLEAGLGLDRLEVEAYNAVRFRGDFGISPTFGLIAASPYFADDLLRVTGGFRGLFLNSEDAGGFRYSGLISSPFLGAVVSPSGFFDFEAGARMHLIDGIMQGQNGGKQTFSNQNILRGYLAATVKSPKESVFLTVDLDVSPGLDSDWSRGPREAQVGISFGALLGWDQNAASGADSSRYFPDFPTLKERQKKMAGELE